MSIPSIFTQAVSSVTPTSGYQNPLALSTSQTSSGGDSTSLSEMGQFLVQLQQLSTNAPSQFQQATSNIASQLQQDAQQQGGNAANFLNKLANQFQTASQTGSMAPLEPHGHHGGHHHSGGANLQSLLSSASSGTSTSGQAASAYSSSSNQSVFSQLLSAIGQALSTQTSSGSASTTS